jgi:ABC-type glycerol-3-phosphate transport system substrate-binding protein
MRRRHSITAVLVIGLALIATACGPGGSATATPSPLTGKLVVWDWQYGTASGKGFESIDKQFAALYPGIQLSHVGQPVANWMTTVNLAFSSQTGPDVIFLDGSPAKIVKYKSLLVPLNRYITPAIRSSLFGWPIVSSQVDSSGNNYALPYNVDAIGFYYNKDLFTKAGLDANNPPTTLAELIKDCAALKSIGVVPVGGGGIGLPDGTLRGLWSGGLTQAETASLATGGLKWTDPKVAAVFQGAVDLKNKGCMDPNWAGINAYTDALKQWQDGKAAIMPYYLGYTPKLNSGEYGVFNVGLDSPQIKYLQFGPSVGWGITKWSKVQDLAWAWINFVTSKQGEQIRFDTDNIAPSNLGVDISKAGADYQYFYKEAKLVPTSALATSYLSGALTNAIQGSTFTAMMTGQKTVAQTLQALQAVQDAQ